MEIEIWVRDNLKSIQIIQVKLALSKGIKYDAVSQGKRLKIKGTCLTNPKKS